MKGPSATEQVRVVRSIVASSVVHYALTSPSRIHPQATARALNATEGSQRVVN